MKAGDDNKLLSLGVACVMDLNTLRQQTLASTLATTAQDGATAFSLHACTEAELAFARALGWLVGALHVVKIFKSRIECPKVSVLSTVNMWKHWNQFFSENRFIQLVHRNCLSRFHVLQADLCRIPDIPSCQKNRVLGHRNLL